MISCQAVLAIVAFVLTFFVPDEDSSNEDTDDEDDVEISEKNDNKNEDLKNTTTWVRDNLVLMEKLILFVALYEKASFFGLSSTKKPILTCQLSIVLVFTEIPNLPSYLNFHYFF